jgi:hypothetical protein
MRIFIRIDLDDNERQIECECGEAVDICPAKIRVILGECAVCDCPVGVQINDLDIVGERDRQ